MVTVRGDNFLQNLLDCASTLKKVHRTLAYIRRWKSISTLKARPISAEEVREAKRIWIRFVQAPMEEDLLNSVSNHEEGGKKKV